MKIDIQEIFKDHQLYHDHLQIDHFITTSSGGTVYGMHKQALRELFKRYRGLRELYHTREIGMLDISSIKKKTRIFFFSTWRNRSIKRKKRKIALCQMLMNMEDLIKNIEDTEREFKQFLGQVLFLREKIGPLTPEKRKTLVIEYWEFQAKYLAAKDLIIHRGIGASVLDMIQCLPIASRNKVTSFLSLNDGKEAVSWFQNYEFPEIKAPVIESSNTAYQALLLSMDTSE